MLLKRLRLNNIRSYINQEINFPEGSTLLSGNIGSGKSTILLAIDFAFFGLKRPELPGAALLRNGTKEGSVELTFQINNNNITIKRTLKREKDSIKQDTGHIIINEQKQDLSSTELKQRILSIFNYPKELLTKSKDLIYTYTIYTPQDRMKQILLGDKDFRLDTLRKVFGIDKYKRINENLYIYIKSLKEQRKLLKVKTEDLYVKIQEKEHNQEKLSFQVTKLDDLNKKIFDVEEQVKDKKSSLELIEKKIGELNKLKQEISLNKNNLLHYVEQRENNNKRIEELEGSIREVPVLEIDVSEIKNRILEKNKQIVSIEEKNKQIIFKIHEAEIKIEDSNKLKKDILELDCCPTCKQEVTQEHKTRISESLSTIEFTEALERNKHEKLLNDKTLTDLKEQVEELKAKENKYNLIKVRIESMQEKKELLKKILLEQDSLKSKIGESNLKTRDLDNKLVDFKGVEDLFLDIKQELDKKLEILKQTEIQKAGIDNETKNIKHLILSLEREILEKEELNKKVTEITKLQEFLENSFSKLMQVMERQIMLRVHSDFDLLFQKWFNTLVEAKELEIKLDNEFTPKILQNGHDLDYVNLSGGEKTAAALAYRLALNQTINKLMSKILTKDIIILDEPTDGFSSEQLDRMRMVLDELEVKQLIIVSHEAKIESFVDNTVRLSKQDHITSILS